MSVLSLRSIAWLALFATILMAWMVMYMMAIGMDLDLIGRPGPMAEKMRAMQPGMPMSMGEGMMAMDRFGSIFAMWAIMMAAMMLPTMVPTLRAYEDLIHSANGTTPGWLGVLLGYFAVWVGFAALITLVQLGLLFGGVIDMLGIAKSTLISGGLLIVVGAFQFTRAKEVCHGVCHSPMTYFLGHWRTGFGGGLRMGLGMGAFCVGCCWGFMALGFVGGVMSLLWMGLATLFMVLEKLPQIGHRVIRPMGMILIAGGLAVLAAPLVMGG
ncbi:DUF2182 domain-containing protein [Roseovarius phycicola]|uniref:DUF2182 domain-containing protein n=1 Tax=Roseovarius phycicola TaxID=3080976 RepID=A0ABZ2HD07_9RHOB